jgi:phosphate:Na+ symporter
LIAAAFTIIIQSSIALVAMLLAMIGNGLLSFESAMFLVLGANVGTTFTAIFASITANTNAKRAALRNLINAAVGVVSFTAIIWPFKGAFVQFFARIIPDPVWQVSMFNLIYNTIAASVLIWFIAPINRLVCLLIRDKQKRKKELHTSYINDHLLDTPTIAIEPIKKEILDMAYRARKSFTLAFGAILTQNLAKKKKIKKQEKWINFLNKAVSGFVVKLSEAEISEQDSRLLGGFHHAIDDIERIGDYAKKMLQEAGRMKKYRYEFSKNSVARGLTDMFEIALKMFDISLEIFEHGKVERLNELHELDREIDKLKAKLADSHIKWLQSAEYNTIGGDHFYSAICDLERIADHIVNFASSIHVTDNSGVTAEKPGEPAEKQTGTAEAPQA